MDRAQIGGCDTDPIPLCLRAIDVRICGGSSTVILVRAPPRTTVSHERAVDVSSRLIGTTTGQSSPTRLRHSDKRDYSQIPRRHFCRTVQRIGGSHRNTTARCHIPLEQYPLVRSTHRSAVLREDLHGFVERPLQLREVQASYHRVLSGKCAALSHEGEGKARFWNEIEDEVQNDVTSQSGETTWSGGVDEPAQWRLVDSAAAWHQGAVS